MIRLIKYSVYTLLLLLSLACIGVVGFLQTPYAKRRLKDTINDLAKREGLSVEYSDISGLMPLSFHVQDVYIASSKVEFKAKKVSIAPNFSMLWQALLASTGRFDRISIGSLVIDATSYTYVQPADTPTDTAIPLAIEISSIHIFGIKLPLDTEKNASFRGDLFIGKKGSSINFSLDCTVIDPKDAAKLSTDKGAHLLRMHLQSTEGKKGAFSCSIKQPIFLQKTPALSTSLYVDFAFSHTALQKLLFRPEEEVETLNGSIYGVFKTPRSSSIRPFLGRIGKMRGDIALFSNRFFQLENLKAFSPTLQLEGSLEVEENTLQKADLQLDLTPLKGAFLSFTKGKLHSHITAKTTEEGLGIALQLTGNDLTFGEYAISSCSLATEGTVQNKAFTGPLHIDASIFGQEITGFSTMFINPEKIELEKSLITSSLGKVEGGCSLYRKGYAEGELLLAVENLSTWLFLPQETRIQGSAETKITFSHEEEQKAFLDITLENALYEDVYAETATVLVDYTFSSHPFWEVSAAASNMRYRNALFTRVEASSNNSQENYPFQLDVSGTWGEELAIKAQGFWRAEKQEVLLTMQELSGLIAKEAFFLEEPFQWRSSFKSAQLTPCTMRFPEGFLSAEVSITEDKKRAFLTFVDCPLQIFSVNPFSIPVKGKGSCKLSIEEIGGKTTGSLESTIDTLTLDSLNLASSTPLTEKDTTNRSEETSLSGKIRASLENDHMSIDLSCAIRENELFKMQGTLPLHLSLAPFQAYVPPLKEVDLHLLYDAKAEDLLDFINTGPHRLQAFVFADLHFAGTVLRPQVKGELLVKDGIYENYYTGSYFEDLSADFSCNGSVCRCPRWEGFDDSGGAVYGSAFFSFNQKKHFPFEIEAHLQDLILVDIPIALAAAKGKASIKGNAKGATAKGDIRVVEARFSLPESLPPSIPSIPLTNKESTRLTPRLDRNDPYPL